MRCDLPQPLGRTRPLVEPLSVRLCRLYNGLRRPRVSHTILPPKNGTERTTGMAKPITKPTTDRNFEATLWAAADKLRGTLDAAEYKHVVLGLIFLKYISDSFEERRAELKRLSHDPDSDLYVKDDAQRERLLE